MSAKQLAQSFFELKDALRDVEQGVVQAKVAARDAYAMYSNHDRHGMPILERELRAIQAEIIASIDRAVKGLEKLVVPATGEDGLPVAPVTDAVEEA